MSVNSCKQAKTKLGCVLEEREIAVIANKFWVQCCKYVYKQNRIQEFKNTTERINI